MERMEILFMVKHKASLVSTKQGDQGHMFSGIHVTTSYTVFSIQVFFPKVENNVASVEVITVLIKRLKGS